MIPAVALADMPKVAPMSFPCDMCGTGSIAKFRGGFVCEKHYYEVIQKDADRYCEQHGLDTTEKKIQHCRDMMRGFVAKQKTLSKERIPGEDDEFEQSLADRANP